MEIPDGFVLVPIEPTWNMLNIASEKTDINSFIDLKAVWEVMIKEYLNSGGR